MFAAVAADGRAHDFGRICQYEMDAQLRQLAYLVGANCMKTMAAEWVEGVQLSRIGPKTRIVVSGNTATVFDGAAPDRAVYANGRWKLAETPRNRRFDGPHGAAAHRCSLHTNCDRLGRCQRNARRDEGSRQGHGRYRLVGSP